MLIILDQWLSPKCCRTYFETSSGRRPPQAVEAAVLPFQLIWARKNAPEAVVQHRIVVKARVARNPTFGSWFLKHQQRVISGKCCASLSIPRCLCCLPLLRQHLPEVLHVIERLIVGGRDGGDSGEGRGGTCRTGVGLRSWGVCAR